MILLTTHLWNGPGAVAIIVMKIWVKRIPIFDRGLIGSEPVLEQAKYIRDLLRKKAFKHRHL